MESSGLGHLYLCLGIKKGDFCLKIAPLSAHLSCRGCWENQLSGSALTGESDFVARHGALMGSTAAPNLFSVQMTQKSLVTAWL